MPKNNNLDEKKKKEIEKLLTEIKDGAPDVTKAEIEELEALLESIIKESDRPLWKRMLLHLGSFGYHLVLMYMISMMVFGLYFDALVLENKWLVFLVGGIVSFVLAVFEYFPRNPFRRHFVAINLMIFTLIIMALYIVNRDIYPVFNMSSVWLFYVITDILLYYLFDFFVLKKLRKE